jgi:hypothetical protein
MHVLPCQMHRVRAWSQIAAKQSDWGIESVVAEAHRCGSCAMVRATVQLHDPLRPLIAAELQEHDSIQAQDICTSHISVLPVWQRALLTLRVLSAHPQAAGPPETGSARACRGDAGPPHRATLAPQQRHNGTINTRKQPLADVLRQTMEPFCAMQLGGRADNGRGRDRFSTL